MVQELTTQPSIFGRLGKGLSRGLSETVPKEIEHQRLKSGLQSLANDYDKGNLSQAQFLARAAGTYGATPQMIQSFGELAKFQGERRAAEAAGGMEQPTREKNGTIPSQSTVYNKEPERKFERKNLVSEVNQRLSPEKQKGVTTYSPVSAALSDIREPTQHELFQKRSEILKKNPWMSVPEAERQAADFFQRQNAQAVAEIEKGGRQEQIEAKVASKQEELKKNLGTLGKDVPQEVFDRSTQRQLDAVANKGKTPTRALNDEKNNMMEFARAYNSLKNNIGTRPYFSVASPEFRKSIKNLKPVFEKNNELPLFKNTLVNDLDIGDHVASLETWSPGKKVEKLIIDTSVNDSPEKIASKIGHAISKNENESLFSIGYLLNKIGVDDKAVIDEIMNLSRNGLVSLNQRQIQEGSEYYPVKPNLEDDFFLGMSGLIGSTILRYITGQREKLGPVEKLKRRYGGKE